MKYLVSGVVTVSCNTVVEAKSKKKALEITRCRDLADLCHRPYVEDFDESFHIETDGDVKEFTVDIWDDEDEDDY